MNALLVCCTPCVCDSRIILDTNAIWITLIICTTIFITVSIFLLYFRFNPDKKSPNETDKGNTIVQQNKEELTPEGKKEKEEKEKQEKEEKKTKDFLDYCYKMAKSLEKGNENQREDCWKIILHIHANCIPDELKQKYNVGNNVVDNVANPE